MPERSFEHREGHNPEFLPENELRKETSLSAAQIKRLASEFSDSHPDQVKEEVVKQYSESSVVKKRYYGHEIVEAIKNRINERVPEGWVKKEHLGGIFTSLIKRASENTGIKPGNYFDGKTLYEYYSPDLINEAKLLVQDVKEGIETIRSLQSLSKKEFFEKLRSIVPGYKGYSNDESILSTQEIQQVCDNLIQTLEEASTPDAKRRAKRAQISNRIVAEFLSGFDY